MRCNLLSLLLLAFVSVGATARVTTVDSIAANPGRAGGVYFAYPVTENTVLNHTPVPEGYEAFYVSHYGRHGSRYLISDKDYIKVMDILADAENHGALTPLGMELKAKMDTIYEEARGRGGELTPLGARQHRQIAHRLIEENPSIFAGTPEITAKSTVVMRCAHSMFAFCEGLKEVIPSLEIPRESGNRSMDYLNYHTEKSNYFSGHNGDWYQLWRKFRSEKTNPERLVKSIFSDNTFIDRRVDPTEFMWDLYWVAVDLQNMETDIELYNLFTAQELFDLWQVFNFNFYACNSSYPLAEGTLTDNAKNLVRNILDTADDYIAAGKNGATLRFGHDGNIIPLTALLRLNDCYAYEADAHKLADVYADYSISPMASNFQMIFYRNPADNDVIIKMLLNEQEIGISDVKTDIYPYYKWSDMSQWLQKVLDTPSKEFISSERKR